jgi:phospholipid/cholesterol/gamma-HCH transport system substrate-binding protein
MGKHPSLTIAAVVVVAVGLVIALARPAKSHLDVKCYFQDAQGLRVGAKVRLAGVEVGSVTGVRVRPERRDQPAEVMLSLQTPYELNIPNDSVVTLETAGILGEVFPEIDIRGASGPPLQAHGVLKTSTSVTPTPQEWLECFSNVVEHKPCDLRGRGASIKQSETTNSKSK